MTYVVNENCIKCKYMDCVEVCPVDCFYEGENMLVIHPDECIDCGVCEPECPVDAIKADSEPGLEKWLSLNAEYAKIWPNITVKKHSRRTLRSGRGSRTNSNTSRQIPARVIEPSDQLSPPLRNLNQFFELITRERSRDELQVDRFGRNHASARKVAAHPPHQSWRKLLR